MGWEMWALMIVGTTLFWVVVGLVVRAVIFNR